MSTTLKLRISDLLKKSVGLPGSNDNCCQLPAPNDDSAAEAETSGGCCSATGSVKARSNAAPDKRREEGASS